MLCPLPEVFGLETTQQGTPRVPGLPIRGCNSSVPRCAKLSAIGVTEKIFFDCLYLDLGPPPIDAFCNYVLGAHNPFRVPEYVVSPHMISICDQ